MISIPFSGSKKYSYKQVKEIVQAGNYESVFEPFGGSCVLSVNLFYDGLVKRAVVNDYDHFFDNYLEYLAYKDWVVNECLNHGIKPRKGCGHFGEMRTYWIDSDKVRHSLQSKPNEEEKEYLQSLLKQVPKKLWSYFALGSNFVYSSRSSTSGVKLSDFRYFKSYLPTDKQRNYLKVLKEIEVENMDYNDFLDKHSSSFNKDSLLILDPPYIGTNQFQYKSQFTEEKTIKLINTAKNLKCDFIFFNHNQDQIEEWLQGLNYSIQLTGKKSITANKNRKDVMAYVKNGK